MELTSIAIVGPTASGKTTRAVQVARHFDGEILSADSRQIYRGMTIGTGKDLDEYGDIPFHLIDICDAGEKYNLHRYLRQFRDCYDDVRGRGKTPVICGGSGMYIENALNGITMPEVEQNPELRKSLEGKTLQELTSILSTYKTLHNTTDVDTVKRAVRAIEICEYYNRHPEEAAQTVKGNADKINAVVIGVDIPRDARRKRISQRLRARLDEGMVDEVRSLLDSGIPAEDLIYYGLEYKFVTLYITGKLGYEEMVLQLETAIHQFAKRQMTWFRGMEKRGIPINWLPYDMTEPDFIESVSDILRNHIKTNI